MPRSLIKPAGGYPEKTCPCCHEVFTPARHDQINCSKACKSASDNFEKARAQKAYRAIYHWVLSGGRMGKGVPGARLGDITRMVRDEWIAEDRREGRPVPPAPFTNR